jgi:hypothetical protein
LRTFNQQFAKSGRAVVQAVLLRSNRQFHHIERWGKAVVMQFDPMWEAMPFAIETSQRQEILESRCRLG